MVLLFCIVTLMNFYVFDRLTGLLWQSYGPVSLIYAVVLSSLIGASFLIRSSGGRDISIAFMTVTSIFSLEFSALTFLLIFELVNIITPLPRFPSGLGISVTVLSITIVSLVNARLISVRKVCLDFPENIRLAHISDLHLGTIHGRRYLRRLVDMTNARNPDIVAITGDMTSGAADPEPGLFDDLARLKARVFLVTGNHEYYEGPGEIMRLLPPNVEMLRDDLIEMPGYSIFGMDYTEEQGITSGRDVDISAAGPVIVLTHVPQFLKLPDYSIILSGHYHAGQVFPFNFLGHVFIRYFRGIYRKGRITLHVSSGSATWGPPMRFGSMNEIVILELGKG